MDNNNHSDQDMLDGSTEKEEGYASSNNFGDEDLNDTRNHITDEEQDPDELEDIKERVREMEDEAEKLRQMQGEGSSTGNINNSNLSLASASSTCKSYFLKWLLDDNFYLYLLSFFVNRRKNGN